jgi:hypothetical protein
MLQVEESAKGTPPAQVILPLLGWTSEEQSLRVGQLVIVFLVRTERLEEFEPLPQDIASAIQRYGLALLPGSIGLLRLSSPALSVVTMDLRTLRDPEEIITAIVDAAAAPSADEQAPLKTVMIPPPPEVDVGAGLYGGAPIALEMPVDQRLERLAREWAKSGYDVAALTALRLFPAADNLEVLRRYLDSDKFLGTALRREGEGIYPHRAAAWEILQSSGIHDIPRPVIVEPHDRYLPVGAWRVVVALAVLLVFSMALCRRLFHRYTPLRLATSGAAVIAVAIIALWVRSYWMVDELLLETEYAQNWLVSSGGELTYRQISDLPDQLAPRLMPLEEQTADVIDAGWKLQAERYSPRGLIRATYPPDSKLKLWLPSQRVAATSGAASVSLALLLLLCFIPPAILGFLELKQYVQMRDRLLKRRCIHCGYDLRASRGRCPECGVEVALR